MPTYKEQQILDKVCKVTRQKQIKYYDFIPFFDFQYEKLFPIVSPSTFHLAPRSLPMPHEVFDLLIKEILGLTRSGIDTPGSVTITFSNLRRLSYLFDQFQDCGGFRKQLGKGKGKAKLIESGLVNNE